MRSLISVTLFALSVCPAFAQPLQYQPFDVPGARLTRPFGVNASGQIVGVYQDAERGMHGFLRNPDGTFATIDMPGATFTNATAINARGDIVGRWTDAAGINHGYLLTAEGITSIDPPSPCVATSGRTVIHGLNDVRDLVGRCFDAQGKELGWLLRRDGSSLVLDDPAFLTTDAWSITNRGEIAGDYTDAAGFVHGYTWTPETGFVTIDVPGEQTGLREQNERGDITGIYATDLARLHGFLLSASGFETIDYPGSISNGGTLVINNPGLIVGGFIDAAGEHGFIASRK